MDAPSDSCLTESEPRGIPASDPDDREMVSRAKRGDRAAFDELMRRYQREIIAVAYRMLGDYQCRIGTFPHVPGSSSSKVVPLETVPRTCGHCFLIDCPGGERQIHPGAVGACFGDNNS